MTKVTLTYRNFANAPKNSYLRICILLHVVIISLILDTNTGEPSALPASLFLRYTFWAKGGVF